ncbi:MAG: NlpC/P60 family protein [Desulfobacteraceae bacterium]
MVKYKYIPVFVLTAAALFFSCSPSLKERPAYSPDAESFRYSIQYSVQAGAFRKFSNAERFTLKIRSYADAFCFKDEDGLFKVRFGNFGSRRKAVAKASHLKSLGIITDFFVIPPGYETKDRPARGPVRKRIVAEAEKYLGIPYQWGGESPNAGFDCSGLTLSVYRKVGIDLPRTAQNQFGRGRFVKKQNLTQGDLVFFKSGGRISHVGVYIGGGRFIHAPGRGKTVCRETLDRRYFKRRYAGGRTYIRM